MAPEKGDPMGFDDIVNKGKELFEQNKERIDDALHSEQAESISDKVLDGAADLAKKVAPDSVDGKIDELRDKADGAIGQ